jgi:hypothetical protein
LFKEKLPFKTFKPTQASGNRLLMGFEGKLNNGKKIGQNNFKNGTDDLTHIVTKFPKKDSL